MFLRTAEYITYLWVSKVLIGDDLVVVAPARGAALLLDYLLDGHESGTIFFIGLKCRFA